MKKSIIVAVMLLVNLYVSAQTDPIRTEQNFIFQHINKALIPTGYLNDYGPEVIEKKWLTGLLNDSNLVYSIDVFNLLYNDIENSRIDLSVPPMISFDSINSQIDLARYDTVSNLALISADYAVLREDAVQQNLFTVSGNQIFDVVNRTQSPYIAMHTFAAVPVLPESPFKNQIKLGYQPLFYSNLGKVVALVKIDFMDGLGYQTIYNNGTKSTISKIYSDSSGYKKFVVKVIYTDNSLDECYTQQFVNVIRTLYSLVNTIL